MIINGIDPSNILLTTFTNKAANEMKERIIEVVGEKGNSLTVGTYHSICNKILRKYAETIGYNRNFTILDESESDKVIKSVSEANGVDKDLVKLSIASYKSKCMTPQQVHNEATTDSDRTLANCYTDYQDELKRQMCMDFDDLLLNTVLLLENNADILEQVNNRWQYISCDEVQDSSNLDSRLTYLLSGPNHNIFMVGDDFQCLTPDTLIKTEHEEKRIDELKVGEKVRVASGKGKTILAPIDSIKSKDIDKNIIKVTTETGKVLKMTPEHILFAKIEPIQDKYYVYLMFRKDKGYRIGRTSSIRERKDKITNGFEIRLNQECGEKIWILEICSTLEESIYYEQYYSYQYGIPQYRFKSEGTELEQEKIDKLFSSIDTFSRANKLLSDKGLFKEYPHHISQATTRFNKERKRIMFNMFGESRKNRPVNHTINICCKDENFYNASKSVLNNGYKKDDYYVIKHASLKYDDCMDKIHELETLIKDKYNYNIDYNATLTESSKKYKFTPAANLIEGSIVCILDKNNNIIEDKVTNIENINYKGKVYDININDYRNYIANGVCVHNCIYGFRGSDINIMLSLKQNLYPDLKVYNLGVNYRSTENIVNIGKSIISNNKNQIDKEVSCGRGVQGMKGVITTCKTQQEQSKKVVAYIKTLHKKGMDYKDIAVLYRANYLSRNIEKILMENQIKYKLYGGVPFFNRMEVQDILSYVRLTVNFYDFQAFKRSIAVPKRGIGQKTIDKIDDFCRETSLPIRDALVHPKLNLKGKAKASMKVYTELLTELDTLKVTLPPKEFLQQLIAKTGYYTYIMDNYKGEERDNRLQNITELISVASEFDNVEDLVMQAQLYRDELEDDDDAVQLMTIHKSKGLEFRAIIMIDMAEGTLPFHKSLNDKNQLEEERRLAFVGVTRAKDFLFMIYPQNQVIGGQVKYSRISRFLKEIDNDLIIRN